MGTSSQSLADFTHKMSFFIARTRELMPFSFFKETESETFQHLLLPKGDQDWAGEELCQGHVVAGKGEWLQTERGQVSIGY